MLMASGMLQKYLLYFLLFLLPQSILLTFPFPLHHYTTFLPLGKMDFPEFIQNNIGQ